MTRLSTRLALTAALAVAIPAAAACSARNARIAELEEENARLTRENAALRRRYEAPATPVSPIRARCRRQGETWKIGAAGREEVLGNFEGVRREIRATPYYADGQLAGFRLHSMPEGGLGISCGLANGDVLLAAGGIELRGPDTWQELGERARTADELDIAVLRAGVEKTITIEVTP